MITINTAIAACPDYPCEGWRELWAGRETLTRQQVCDLDAPLCYRYVVVLGATPPSWALLDKWVARWMRYYISTHAPQDIPPQYRDWLREYDRGVVRHDHQDHDELVATWREHCRVFSNGWSNARGEQLAWLSVELRRQMDEAIA